MKLCAVDPGVKATGIALFTDYKLEYVKLVRARSLAMMIASLVHVEWPPDYGDPKLVLVERPVVYPRDGIKKAKDLITVALVAGAAAAAFGGAPWTETDFVEPRTWKGSTPKDIHNARVLKILDDDELEVFNARIEGLSDGVVHNVVDAVGIGLYKLGRS